ncbi:MAG: hypothetical protein CL609_08140 [Anaerolineaceae bacterium]|nr:hypothetical protein [Anaerolineaceae bacterium]
MLNIAYIVDPNPGYQPVYLTAANIKTGPDFCVNLMDRVNPFKQHSKVIYAKKQTNESVYDALHIPRKKTVNLF